MKKIISILAIFTVFLMTILTGNTYAVKLDTVQVIPDKTTIRPGENVVVEIQFGKNLSSYTFDIAYDNQIFDYIEAEGGTPNNLGSKVKVNFHDASGGSNPRSNLKVTFRAKASLVTSNPTNFSITADGLGMVESGAVVTLEDITVPIVKNVTVEPEYVDYTLKLETQGQILVNQEKEMTLSYSSSMGKPYAHARLEASYTGPEGGQAKLLATDSSNVEHNILTDGWGDAQGSAIGGKDVRQVLQTRATFDKEGDYAITLKLIDKENADTIIAQETVSFHIAKEATEETPPKQEEEVPPQKEQETSKPTKPSRLPKTGQNVYIPAIAIVITLFALYLILCKRK